MKIALVCLVVFLAAILPPPTAWAQYGQPQYATCVVGRGVYNDLNSGGYYPVAGYGQDFRAEGTSIRLSVPVGKRGRIDVGHVIQKATSRSASAPKPEVVVQKPVPVEPIVAQPMSYKCKIVNVQSGALICSTGFDVQVDKIRIGEAFVCRRQGEKNITKYPIVSVHGDKIFVGRGERTEYWSNSSDPTANLVVHYNNDE